MERAWVWIIAIAVAVTAGYVISLIIEVIKTLQSVNNLLKTTEAGRTPRAATRGPVVDAMSAAGRIQRTREDGRRRLADTERREASE